MAVMERCIAMDSNVRFIAIESIAQPNATDYVAMLIAMNAIEEAL